ncbi:cAMP-binding domain of CRP or a regulatory subunit of cAMP-dependent protein kinases [Chishuiella changwenlii]|uniref:cAMP-binding domain of CRP or a regulatory subunit of cAMP-dependent protein kinases n=1 Tax=Chishuiella changwenlii TaxID=1434701 RepID=A0A1M7D052_9FLAO|nr:Crp/Fnr family transcriptional regulator [Chishuiella changwenlii]GGF10541.1 cAMP-binding protein [Chishuiella changwenlii]SHL72844.1 cAMP-binding domain of CRP or a regulatory subunit of cAMP-dependent protein kinases [Chishuiella changwenlii]
MEELINYLLLFGNLNQQQIELIKNRTTELQLKKDEYFIEPGKMFNHVVFTLEGILRISYYNNKGEEITKYFVDENHLMTNPYKGEPMTEYIQAITNCKLIVFSQKDWNDLSNTIVGWDTITDKIFQKALVEKLDRRSSLVSEDATTRYLTFLEKFPTLANRVPLAYIASYLGITQQSLSRIRKNIR